MNGVIAAAGKSMERMEKRKGKMVRNRYKRKGHAIVPQAILRWRLVVLSFAGG